jgi:hypothetical protein
MQSIIIEFMHIPEYAMMVGYKIIYKRKINLTLIKL